MQTNNNNSEINPGDLITDFFSRVWAPPHNLDAIDQIMTEDYVITSGGEAIRGRRAFKIWVQQFQSLLLEARTVSQEIFWNEQKDRVVSRWVCSGINNGIFGLPADGRLVSFTGIAIWQIADGRLAECWVERSAFELYKSLTG